MRKEFYSSLMVCVLAGLPATGQSISQAPPFSIEQGSSFSASSERRVSVPQVIGRKSPAVTRITNDFAEALDLIKRHHVGGTSTDTAALTKSSINAMLGELDPHSSFYDATEFGVLLGDQESEYSGTGSSISNFIVGGQIETYVIAVQPNTAAARVDLRYGDRIVSVDGVPVSGATVDRVRDQVRGPRGTIVRLVVERAATGITETIELKRDRVVQTTIPNVDLLRDGIGYVDLSTGFSLTTASEFDRVLDDLRRRGMRSLVLDLRGNSGGVLDQAIRVAEKFLPAGTTIISQRGRAPEDNATWTSLNSRPLNIPLVVLVNDQTASAAEVVAGALQDNDRALIIGRSTYGKSLVQKVLELPSGAGLTLTTGRYYTPSGRLIQRSYVSGKLYEYFTHAVTTGTGAATRTITNRPLYSGRGITPDEVIDGERFDARRAELIDPIFFFVREIMRERTSKAVISPLEYSATEIERVYMSRFRAYASSKQWNIKPATLDAELDYIARELRYHLALATVGSQGAKKVRNEVDEEVARAIDALPRAKALAELARRRNEPFKKEKTRQVAFPSGSR